MVGKKKRLPIFPATGDTSPKPHPSVAVGRIGADPSKIKAALFPLSFRLPTNQRKMKGGKGTRQEQVIFRRTIAYRKCRNLAIMKMSIIFSGSDKLFPIIFRLPKNWFPHPEWNNVRHSPSPTSSYLPQSLQKRSDVQGCKRHMDRWRNLISISENELQFDISFATFFAWHHGIPLRQKKSKDRLRDPAL